MTIRVVLETESTQEDVLRELAAGGARWPHLSGIRADHQRSGRGRLGREWTTHALRALTVSFVLRPAAPMQTWGALGLRTAVAVVRALADVGVAAQVKWPNDIVIAADQTVEGWSGIAKVGGILGTIATDREGESACVMGVGINLDGDPPVPWAASLSAAGVTVEADILAQRVRTHLATAVQGRTAEPALAAGSDAGELVAPHCHTLGRHVTVTLPPAGSGELVTVSGEATRIDPDGALVVETRLGERRILAGDVVHTRYSAR